MAFSDWVDAFLARKGGVLITLTEELEEPEAICLVMDDGWEFGMEFGIEGGMLVNRTLVKMMFPLFSRTGSRVACWIARLVCHVEPTKAIVAKNSGRMARHTCSARDGYLKPGVYTCLRIVHESAQAHRIVTGTAMYACRSVSLKSLCAKQGTMTKYAAAPAVKAVM
jgi:hypothetical protein